MNQHADQLQARRQLDFRRLLLASAAAHVAAFLFFAFTPRFRSDAPAAVTVVTVNLLAAPGPAPRPRPAAPAPPKPEKVILPTQPTQPKPKQEAKPKPKPEPEPEPEPKQEPPKPQEVDYDDALAQLRDEAGEKEPPETPPPDDAPSGTGEGGGQLVSAEEAAFRNAAKAHVTRNWILEPGFRLQPLKVRIEVLLAADGEVLSTAVIERSGNPWFDESAERAVAKASPLPRPPEAGEWVFSFSPGDLF